MSKTSAIEDHLGFWLRFVSNHVSQRFAQQLEARGVTVTEWVTLRELFAPEPPSAAELVTCLGMTKGAVSKLLTRLEAKGLVERKSASGDARVWRLRLTRSGRKLVPKLARIADENDAHFFSTLSPRTRQLVTRALRDVVTAHQLTRVPTE